MPIFKKRSFFHHYTDVLHNTLGEATVELLRFIEDETDYNTDLIWQSVIRTCALSDLVRCAQLNRILPRNYICDTPGTYGKLNTGLVFHMYYEDLFDENLSFVSNFPKESGVLITTNTFEKKALIEEKLKNIENECQVVVVENRGRDVSSLLIGAADFVFNYELICFMHDKKSTQVSPLSVGRSWSYKLNENTVASKEFVANVIGMFAKEKWLGMAFPTMPNHSLYSYHVGNGWTGNFSGTKKLLDDFGINVKINEHTLCVAPLGTCFWFRPQTLKKLYAGSSGAGWSYHDFPKEPNETDQTILHVIERVYAYFAQDAGYYPVYLYNDKFAEIEMTNLEFCKVGSQDMRNWVDVLAMNNLGYMPDGAQHNPYCPNNNYGVKHALKMLSLALYMKFPRMWGILRPFRYIAKKLFRINRG
jgi:rhamnosyltransferase